MKKLLLPLLFLIIILTLSCASPKIGYFIEATIYPITTDGVAFDNSISTEGTERNKFLEDLEKPHGMKAQPQPTLDEIAEKTENSDKITTTKQYVCEVTIMEITNDGDKPKEKVISSPKLIFKDGQQASLTIGDEDNNDSITADIIVNDEKNAGFSNIDVHVKENGKTLTRSLLKFKLK